jgi:hypothetical protein
MSGLAYLQLLWTSAFASWRRIALGSRGTSSQRALGAALCALSLRATSSADADVVDRKLRMIAKSVSR